MGALDHARILVPESRELDLFAGMLEAEGATTLRCPLVRILDLEDRGLADCWIDLAIRDPFDDVVFLTGDGFRKLVTLSGAREQDFLASLKKSRLITRGPKPARALREMGLVPGLAAPAPTSDGVLQGLAPEDLSARRIGVQLYPGERAEELVAALERRGALLFPVLPYRYADSAELARVADMIRALAAGEIDIVAFTSSPQVERLGKVARDCGLEQELASGLAKARVASIGPVVTETLRGHGVTAPIQPQGNFHLKPLVRAIAAGWSAR